MVDDSCDDCRYEGSRLTLAERDEQLRGVEDDTAEVKTMLLVVHKTQHMTKTHSPIQRSVALSGSILAVLHSSLCIAWRVAEGALHVACIAGLCIWITHFYSSNLLPDKNTQSGNGVNIEHQWDYCGGTE